MIVHQLCGDAIAQKVNEYLEAVPEAHRDKCRHDIYDDLSQMAPPRLIGLGITLQELEKWLTLQRKP